jgi:hypothetical protein
MKIEMTTSRWLPLLARATGGDRRGHVPAHALPPAERPKADKISNRRKPERHAAHGRVRTAEALGAHRASTKIRQRLVREQAPRIPEVADMLVIGESVWQRGARIARNPALGVAGVVYLVSAWIVVGAATSAPPADGSMAHNAGINPRTGSTSVSGSTPSSWRTEEPDGVAAGVHIDPQFFAALEKTLSDLDNQADHEPLKYRQQGGDEPAPLVDQADASPSDTSVPEASAIAPPAPAVPNPNGQTADAPASDTSVPEASAIAPRAPAVANPNGQTADAPASDASVPEASAIAPRAPAVANPNGTVDAVSQQPLGPLPGPAA